MALWLLLRGLPPPSVVGGPNGATATYQQGATRYSSYFFTIFAVVIILSFICAKHLILIVDFYVCYVVCLQFLSVAFFFGEVRMILAFHIEVKLMLMEQTRVMRFLSLIR